MNENNFDFLTYLKKSGAKIVREGFSSANFWVGRYEYQNLYFEYTLLKMQEDKVLVIFDKPFDTEEEDTCVYCGKPPQDQQFAEALFKHIKD